jgi:antitoxin ParD1/3/4
MAQMNVSLPDALKAWAEARVAEGLYSSTSDYVRDLMRRDMTRSRYEAEDIERLRAAWEEGLASGEPVEGNFDVDDNVRRSTERLKEQRKRGTREFGG